MTSFEEIIAEGVGSDSVFLMALDRFMSGKTELLREPDVVDVQFNADVWCTTGILEDVLSELASGPPGEACERLSKLLLGATVSVLVGGAYKLVGMGVSPA